MSRRYGRKQKRRARQEIEDLHALVDMKSRAAEREADRAHTLEWRLDSMVNQFEEWDAEVQRLFGQYSAFRFSAPSLQVSDVRAQLQLQVYDQLLSTPWQGPHMNEAVRVRVGNIRKFLVELTDGEIGELRKLIRLRVTDGRTSALAISDEVYNARAFGNSGDVRIVAEEIARQLLEHMRTAP